MGLIRPVLISAPFHGEALPRMNRDFENIALLPNTPLPQRVFSRPRPLRRFTRCAYAVFTCLAYYLSTYLLDIIESVLQIEKDHGD